eukprot:gene20268-biopygen884
MFNWFYQEKGGECPVAIHQKLILIHRKKPDKHVGPREPALLVGAFDFAHLVFRLLLQKVTDERRVVLYLSSKLPFRSTYQSYQTCADNIRCFQEQDRLYVHICCQSIDMSSNQDPSDEEVGTTDEIVLKLGMQSHVCCGGRLRRTCPLHKPAGVTLLISQRRTAFLSDAASTLTFLHLARATQQFSTTSNKVWLPMFRVPPRPTHTNATQAATHATYAIKTRGPC